MGSRAEGANVVLAESAAMIAVASVLFMVKLFVFTQGGEITLGSMVPILLLALRRGVRVGVLSGGVFGLVVLGLEPFIYHPIQVFLDYPLAFGALGLAGLLRGRGWWGALCGASVGIGARFLCHFASGVLFISYFAPDVENPYVYSAIYNGSYLLPELAISASAITILANRGLIEAKVRKIGPPPA